jgi:hypothetical protein
MKTSVFLDNFWHYNNIGNPALRRGSKTAYFADFFQNIRLLHVLDLPAPLV